MDSDPTSSSSNQNENQSNFLDFNENTQAQLYYSCLNMICMSNLLSSPQISEIPNISEEDSDEKAYTCCSMSFQGKRGLNQHIGRLHNNFEKTSECTQCGRSFRHKNALSFHIKQVHEKSTRVRCSKCGMMVYNKYMMKNHNKKYHPPETNIG
ncbi:unnamed protein product [Blepharisma stoltei]|uniref:C2H2-type domain-containing protein n=1 Tax=Blepharisma stoltei TaxID=1481888 RepID=A0AAU9KCQ8_9CILI|nr:unnamed protein product [Blepharisma stoltei]